MKIQWLCLESPIFEEAKDSVFSTLLLFVNRNSLCIFLSSLRLSLSHTLTFSFPSLSFFPYYFFSSFVYSWRGTARSWRTWILAGAGAWSGTDNDKQTKKIRAIEQGRGNEKKEKRKEKKREEEKDRDQQYKRTIVS